jgi:maltose alpha-D-glucosyltransferase/alpha-amylase
VPYFAAGEKLMREPLVKEEWEEVIKNETILMGYLQSCRWFSGKGRKISKIKIKDKFPFRDSTAFLVDLAFSDGATLCIFLPVTLLSKETSNLKNPEAIIAKVKGKTQGGILIDALYNEEFRKVLLDVIANQKKVKGMIGQLQGFSTPRLKKILQENKTLSSFIVTSDQSNTSAIYGDKLFLKCFRSQQEGLNTDVELTRFLSLEANFDHVPPFLGTIEWTLGNEKRSLALLEECVLNTRNLWTFALENIQRYFNLSLVDGKNLEEAIGGNFLETIALLGKRAAQMHQALATSDDPDFKPEKFTQSYQKSLYTTMRNQLKHVFSQLEKHQNLSPMIPHILSLETTILKHYQFLQEKNIEAYQMRIHGDFHLGQVLQTGKDLVIIDFEGEPLAPLSEKRLKKNCLQDIAGMVRSFHYALSVIFNQRKDQKEKLNPFFLPWYEKTKNVFLQSYLQKMENSPLISIHPGELKSLFQVYLLHKAVYEVGYELNYRPDWIEVPLNGILLLLGEKNGSLS